MKLMDPTSQLTNTSLKCNKKHVGTSCSLNFLLVCVFYSFLIIIVSGNYLLRNLTIHWNVNSQLQKNICSECLICN